LSEREVLYKRAETYPEAVAAPSPPTPKPEV
jgi:hypothetical protein